MEPEANQSTVQNSMMKTLQLSTLKPDFYLWLMQVFKTAIKFAFIS